MGNIAEDTVTTLTSDTESKKSSLRIKKLLKEKDWHDFVCGGGAAAVNLLVTFPAFKLMLRQQVDGVSTLEAFKQLKREGFGNLYRGFLPPLLQKATSVSVMFGSYHKFQKILLIQYPTMNPVLAQASAAVIAGTIEAALTPFERVQTLLSDQRHNARIANTLHAFLKIRKHYNFKEYYRGFSAIVLRNGPSSALFFTLREPIKHTFPDATSQLQSSLEDFISGAVLGACLSTLFYPLNVMKSNMQKHLGGPYHGIIWTFKKIYKQRGGSIRKMYFGVSVNFTRALVSWGIINATYEIFKKVLESYDT